MPNITDYDISAGAIGINVYIDMKQSVLGATDITLRIEDEDGDISEWTGLAVSGTNKFKYTTVSGDVPSTARGTWRAQPFFTLGGLTTPGKKFKIQIGPAIGAA